MLSYLNLNHVLFSPRSILTAGNLISINSTTGVMKAISGEIDCDLPVKILYLEYDVILTDGVWTTQGAIQIKIQDINNKEPMVDAGTFEQQISIYENETTGFWIQRVTATDADRDRKLLSLIFESKKNHFFQLRIVI